MGAAMKKVILTVLIVVGVLVLALALRKAAQILDTNQTIQVRTVPPAAPDAVSSEAFQAWSHPIHAGGVKNVAALRALLERNPEIAEHFKAAGFDIDCAQDEILAANVWGIVSYRTASGFAYTHNPVLLLAGEHVIVDGCHGIIIRGRCANVVILIPHGPELSADSTRGGVLGAPPDSVIPDIPTPLPPIDVPPALPGTPPGSGTGVPFYPVPLACCFDGSAPPARPPVAAPEPPLWMMLLVGWGAVFIAFRILRGPR